MGRQVRSPTETELLSRNECALSEVGTYPDMTVHICQDVKLQETNRRFTSVCNLRIDVYRFGTPEPTIELRQGCGAAGASFQGKWP